MKKNTINKLIAGTLLLGSVLSLNPITAMATDADGGFEENGVYYSSQEAKNASDAYAAKYPLTNECSEDYKKKDDRWCNKDGKWYFAFNKFTEDKRLADTWYDINGFWYHFNAEDGAMDKDVTLKDPMGNDCILNSDGALTNRKEPDLGDEYEFTTYSELHPDVNKIKKGWDMGNDDKWHYYNQKGEMQKNTTIIENGKKYVIDANGDWIA